MDKITVAKPRELLDPSARDLIIAAVEKQMESETSWTDEDCADAICASLHASGRAVVTNTELNTQRATVAGLVAALDGLLKQVTWDGTEADAARTALARAKGAVP